MDSREFDPCLLCDYAGMRDDICGVYCVGEYWKNSDGTCDHFKPLPETKEEYK